MMRPHFEIVSALLLAAAMVGCGSTVPEPVEEAPESAGHQRQAVAEQARLDVPGKRLFEEESFKGNGRTCRTCHGEETGTISQEQLQARFQANPADPVFSPIDSDDGTGRSYTRLLNEATFNVTIPLAPNVRLAANPGATSVKLRRSVPSTLDTPSLEPVLMWDGREPDLASQARSAILEHSEPGRVPPGPQLDMLASYQQTLFSSDALRAYANGGPEPMLPEGTTDAERRGRAFFASNQVCGACHSGPLLNQVPEGNVLGLQPGIRFARVLVSELNPGRRPLQRFVLTRPDGSRLTFSSPDPGRLLLTGKLEDIGTFKIGILWNIQNTAPYFHDGSARTLEEVMAHYERFFRLLGITLTPQDQADIVAFMKLL